MSGGPSRVAVQVGSATVRIAGAAAEGEPWLVAELPDPAAGLDQLLSELVGTELDELVVVHPPSWPEPRVAVLARGLIGLAGQLRTVPVPLAAAGLGPRVVLDVGHTGAEVTRLARDGTVQLCRSSPVGGALLDEVLADRLRSTLTLEWSRRVGAGLVGIGQPACEVPTRRRVSAAGGGPAAGGAAGGSAAARAPGSELSELELLAEARRVRERLSLLPSADARLPGRDGTLRIRAGEVHRALAAALRGPVELLREVLLDGDPVPVLLIGGVARAPLLAELVDELFAELARPVNGWEGMSAPVNGSGTGGARRPSREFDCPDVVVAPTPEATAVLGALSGLSTPAPVPSPAPACGRDPPVAFRSSTDPPPAHAAGNPAGHARSRFPLPPRRRPVRTALLATAAAVLVAALLAVGAVLAPPSGAVAVPAGVLVQYGYRLDLPAGWAHTGGLPERRRVLLTPVTAPDGSDVIAVERTPLGYNGDAERQRALAELRAVFDAAVSGGSALSDFQLRQLAGREVVSYRQGDADGGSEVDWYVIIDGDAQLSVGCRHTPSAATAVRAACALVVASARRG